MSKGERIKLRDAPKLSVGDNVGRLVVLKDLGTRMCSGLSRRYWLCECLCGNLAEVLDQSLRTQSTKSCGCIQTEASHTVKHKHASGGKQTKTYMAWRDMIQRCGNSNNPHYYAYGGRGIKVCESWLKFENFLFDMGEAPIGLSLDRTDVDLGYCKENCKWVNWTTQVLHTRIIQLITYKGITQSPRAWSMQLGISIHTIYSRRRRGLSVEKVLSVENLNETRKQRIK